MERISRKDFAAAMKKYRGRAKDGISPGRFLAEHFADRLVDYDPDLVRGIYYAEVEPEDITPLEVELMNVEAELEEVELEEVEPEEGEAPSKFKERRTACEKRNAAKRAACEKRNEAKRARVVKEHAEKCASKEAKRQRRISEQDQAKLDLFVRSFVEPE